VSQLHARRDGGSRPRGSPKVLDLHAEVVADKTLSKPYPNVAVAYVGIGAVPSSTGSTVNVILFVAPTGVTGDLQISTTMRPESLPSRGSDATGDKCAAEIRFNQAIKRGRNATSAPSWPDQNISHRTTGQLQDRTRHKLLTDAHLVNHGAAIVVPARHEVMHTESVNYPLHTPYRVWETLRQRCHGYLIRLPTFLRDEHKG